MFTPGMLEKTRDEGWKGEREEKARWNKTRREE